MTYPTPRLHSQPDPAPERGDGDWRLYLWVPVVFAVACIRALRWRLAGWLIALGCWIAPDAPDDPARHDRIAEGIAAAVASAVLAAVLSATSDGAGELSQPRRPGDAWVEGRRNGMDEPDADGSYVALDTSTPRVLLSLTYAAMVGRELVTVADGELEEVNAEIRP